MSKHVDSDMFDGFNMNPKKPKTNVAKTTPKAHKKNSNQFNKKYSNDQYSSTPNNVHMSKGSKITIVLVIVVAVILIGLFGIHAMNKNNPQNVKVYKILPKYSWYMKLTGNVGPNNPNNFNISSKGSHAAFQFKNGKVYVDGNTGSSDNSYNYMPTKHTLTMGNSNTVDDQYTNQTYKLVSVNGKSYKFDLIHVSDSNQGQENIPKKDQNKMQMTLTKAGPSSF